MNGDRSDLDATIAVRPVSPSETRLIPGLCDLLADAVNGGASVGFLSPLSKDSAAAYWRQIFSTLGDGLRVWIAESDGGVVGSVQLAPSQRENSPHRAEVQKLFVRSSSRGKGIASCLLTTAEAFARENGRTLLVLDTEQGSPAEDVYRHLGWTKAGEVPGWALTPDGRLHTTVYYYKNLL